MKKIATLLLAAGLLFSAAGMAQAIDFKIRGQWIMAFDYGEHGAFTGGNGMTGYKKGNEDNFEARQRLRLQLDAVASENLSGSVIFEMGDQIWGQSATGGALGADGTVVEVKNAWLDWMVPDTDIKVRMGLQGFFLPSMTTGSQVWGDDAAGITASWQINENVALTALWARLYNDNFQGYGDDGLRKNYMDNVDVAALLLPLTFDGFRLTPWAMYAGIGPNSLDADHANDWKSVGVSGIQYLAGMLPAGGASHNSRMDLYGNAFWAGLTGELTLPDPWRIAWDLNYGSVSYDDTSANRAGWLASLLVEYPRRRGGQRHDGHLGRGPAAARRQRHRRPVPDLPRQPHRRYQRSRHGQVAVLAGAGGQFRRPVRDGGHGRPLPDPPGLCPGMGPDQHHEGDREFHRGPGCGLCGPVAGS